MKQQTPDYVGTGRQSVFDARAYNFVRVKDAADGNTRVTGDLSASGAGKVLTFIDAPRGMLAGGYVYIVGGTGTAEAALITASTCALQGGGAGTITITTANTHTGQWRVTSATSGVQEAVNCQPSGTAFGVEVSGPYAARAFLIANGRFPTVYVQGGTKTGSANFATGGNVVEFPNYDTQAVGESVQLGTSGNPITSNQGAHGRLTTVYFDANVPPGGGAAYQLKGDAVVANMDAGSGNDMSALHVIGSIGGSWSESGGVSGSVTEGGRGATIAGTSSRGGWIAGALVTAAATTTASKGCSGIEINTTLSVASPAGSKVGVLVVDISTQLSNAATSMAYGAQKLGGSNIGYTYGLKFGDSASNDYFPITSTGTLMYLGVGTTANGIDVSAAQFTGYTFNAGGFRVKGDANATAAVRRLTVYGGGETSGVADAGNKSATVLLASTGGSPGDGGQVEFGFGFGSYQPSFAAIKGNGVSAANNTTGDVVFYTRRLAADVSMTEAARVKVSGIINFSNTPEYADNAAAVAGGLVNGDVYRTGDVMKIVHP